MVKTGPLWKMKGNQLVYGHVKVFNLMMDLINLAEKHNIENKLYYGEGLDVIYGMFSDSMLKTWLSRIIMINFSGPKASDKCFICDETDHVPTIGPKGTLLIR